MILKQIFMKKFLLVACSLSLCAVSFASDPKIKSAESYQFETEILFGGKGGWDYPSLEPKSHQLFISHADRIVVIDAQAKKVIKEISDTPGVHGIAIASDLKKAFSSHGKEGKVGVIDLTSLTLKSKITVGENPDTILYVPSEEEVYVFNGGSKSVSIIDAKSEKVKMTLTLPGSPEFAVVDSVLSRVFVNLEDKNSLLALNTKTHQIEATWKLEGCEGPSGLALDAKNHRLFSVCENEKMVMVNEVSGKTIASVPTGLGTDGAEFDQEKMLAFASNGKSGTLTVAKEESPDKLTLMQTVKTEPGARTIVLDPIDHRIYLPTAQFEPAVKGERPKPVEGTQKVLVYKP